MCTERTGDRGPFVFDILRQINILALKMLYSNKYLTLETGTVSSEAQNPNPTVVTTGLSNTACRLFATVTEMVQDLETGLEMI